MTPLHRLTATQMAKALREKQFSPVELVQAHLDRIEQLNPQLNAFISLDAERALEQARAAGETLQRGDKVGPLHGVPLSIKGSVELAGHPHEVGSKLREGIVGERDAPLVARLKAAGAIILGVTNTPEMLMAWETDNLLYGRTNSPWDPERTPGGSSGGESAAISACLSAGGVGSDGGGSIRVPAHFSGICGLKPTPGRIPLTGHVPSNHGPFGLIGVAGPMARSVADLRLLFDAMAGPDPGDPFSCPVPLREITREDLKSITIGYLEEDGRTPVTPETRAAVRDAAEALERRGFRVRPFRPEGLLEAGKLWYTLFGPGLAYLLGSMVEGRERELSPILREFLDWMATEPPFTLDTLMTTLTRRDEVRAGVLTEMEEVPVFLSPVCSTPAFRHREREWTIEGLDVAYLDSMTYCGRFNLLGNPSAVVPTGRSPEGLPIGVQIVARPHEEELALVVAAEIESDLGGYQPPPLG